VKRLIGSVRQECLEHVIVLNEEPVRRILTDYLSCDHRRRTHRFLGEVCPEPRAVEPPDQGIRDGVFANSSSRRWRLSDGIRYLSSSWANGVFSKPPLF
jgi:hypothetical protein